MSSYGCPHCDSQFDTTARLGGHVSARHTDHHRSLPKFLRTPSYAERTIRTGPSRKRPTDTWPSRP